MVESVQVFNYGENTPVRVRVMNGQTWFVAKDVCKVLGISNHKDAVSRLDDDEMRGVGITDLIGRTQRMSAVSESGLYHLVFQSRKPEARKFRRWVTGEVLPQIRMTGGYHADLRRDELLRRDESRLYEGGATGANPQAAGDAMNGDAMNGDAMNRVSTTRLPIPRKRSAALGAFYAELRKWVLKEDEAAVAELMGVSPGHVREVLAGRKPGYGVLCLLMEYATENRAAGRRRVVRSAARRAEQVEELRLDFMCGVAPLRMGSTAREPQNRAGSHEADMRAGSPRSEVVLRPDGRRTGGGDAPLGDAMNRVSTAKAQDVTDGIIDFNGMEG